MARPAKSLVTAYVFWVVLPGLGAHRFYLKRPLSGLFLLMICLTGMVLAIFGTSARIPEYVMAGGTCVLAVLVWWILDAFFIPGWVDQINEEGQDRPYVSVAAVNMDPSFGATMSAAGRNPDAKTRPALSESHDLPWRQERKQQEILRYHTSDEAGLDARSEQEADDDGHPPR
ncbi:MAG: TM2 domain-containing protein [Pseudomonadota bacterium]